VTDSGCPPYQTAPPVLWERGKVQQLPTVEGDPDGYALGINELGQVVGLPCSIGGTAGTVSLGFAGNGVVTLTCNLPPPPPPPPPPNATCSTPVNLGTLNSGNSASVSGDLTPAGYSEWYVFTWLNSSQATLSFTGGSGLQFDVNTSCGTTVVSAATSAATLTTSGTYYFRIYGATSSVTGAWTMSLAVQ
jgi:hypothetical protein